LVKFGPRTKRPRESGFITPYPINEPPPCARCQFPSGCSTFFTAPHFLVSNHPLSKWNVSSFIYCIINSHECRICRDCNCIFKALPCPWCSECDATFKQNEYQKKKKRKPTLRTPSSFVASIIFPFVLSAPVMNAFCPVVLPSAISTKVSSARMIVTSGFNPCVFASPFFTVPVFFKSTIHQASFPSAFLTRNSKMPLFWFVRDAVQKGGGDKKKGWGARTFLSCAALSVAFNPSNISASAARVSEVCKTNGV
jgi:hypothetical protein